MPSLYAEIEINAPKSVVWQALVRKQDWLRWNTFLFDRDPDRAFVQGQFVFLSLKRVADEAETEFEPRITLLQPETCLAWVSSAPGFRSEHVFELQEVGWNRTKYVHRESLSGVVSRLFLPFLKQDEHQGLRRMARELKLYSEARG